MARLPRAQNPEYLILVMDLITSGDLSEFVLTKKRLTAPQVHWALTEVVEVFGYMHSCMIMYRDLKPENLLVDDEGHVRPAPLNIPPAPRRRPPGASTTSTPPSRHGAAPRPAPRPSPLPAPSPLSRRARRRPPRHPRAPPARRGPRAAPRGRCA